MFKTVIVLTGMLLATSSINVAAQSTQPMPKPIEECATQAPYGWPTIALTNSKEICRTAYVLLHDNVAKIAPWVVYTLTSAETTGCQPRFNSFAPDHSLSRGQRAELSDYANSGYDTGHMANNADMSWSRDAAKESFILSNMAPQLPALNRGAWRQLESAVRSWAFVNPVGITIYVGSIYNQSDKKIGPNQVVVPNAFYKIVIDNHTRQSLAFMFPHVDVDNFRSAQSTVAEIEKASGIKFPVPDSPTAKHTIWQTNYASMNNGKRYVCRG